MALLSLSWYNFSAPAAGNGTTSFIRLRPQLASQLAPLVHRLAYRRAAALLPFCSLRLCFHGGAWACPIDTPSTARKSRPRAPLLLRPQRCHADLVLRDAPVGFTPLPLPWPPPPSPQPPQPQPCLRPHLAVPSCAPPVRSEAVTARWLPLYPRARCGRRSHYHRRQHLRAVMWTLLCLCGYSCNRRMCTRTHGEPRGRHFQLKS